MLVQLMQLHRLRISKFSRPVINACTTTPLDKCEPIILCSCICWLYPSLVDQWSVHAQPIHWTSVNISAYAAGYCTAKVQTIQCCIECTTQVHTFQQCTGHSPVTQSKHSPISDSASDDCTAQVQLIQLYERIVQFNVRNDFIGELFWRCPYFKCEHQCFRMGPAATGFWLCNFTTILCIEQYQHQWNRSAQYQ